MVRRLIIWWIGYLLVLSFSSEINALKKRVCVIGAGAAGLTSVKQLADRLDEFEPVVFEKNSDLGGLWLYSDNTGVDQFNLPVHSSVYSNMRTNVPTDIMAFPDYKNFTDGHRCAPFEVVLQYLRDFTSDFNLRQYIRFNTLVEKVSPTPSRDGQESSWIVSTLSAKTKQRNEEICHAVIVCNGHNFKPYIPKIPGIESFPGRILHSHLYRKADEFKSQIVIILGAGPSGRDIAVEMSKYAKKIFLSHRRAKFSGEQPPNLIQVASVIAANGSELTLQDGSKITADAFIYCTGYVHDYPFLDESSGVHLMNRGKDVGPLYKYVINVEHNSMGFLGMIPIRVLSFPMYFLQAQYFVAALQGKMKLPNRTEMLKDIEDMESLPGTIIDFEWAYYNEYEKKANITPLSDYYKTAAKLWLRHISDEPFYLKDYNLHVADDGQLTIYKPDAGMTFEVMASMTDTTLGL